MHKNVVCLKYGKKYSSEYVNNLHKMVSRNLQTDHRFVCITEDSSGLNKEIEIIGLPKHESIEGWWFKPFIFDPDMPLKGTNLFIDLDVVIFNDIQKLFAYDVGKFCIIKDFFEKRKGRLGMNSSCFRFEHGTHSNVYYDFIKNHKQIMASLHGDQDWIQSAITSNFSYWPENWIKSFKWEMHKESDIVKRGDEYFIEKDPCVEAETSIAVFHGLPKPHQIQQAWCKTNWR